MMSRLARWLVPALLSRSLAFPSGTVNQLVLQSSGPETTVFHHGATYELVTHSTFPDYALKLKQPKLCDTSVKQYSGYFDVGVKHHLFFWYFESRSDPVNDPLVLWLNGGPGCSSFTGLLTELGPCNIQEGGNGTDYNEWGWNEHANLIFLDQPVNVGYSWTEGELVYDSNEAGKDFYAFLQLFYSRFSQLQKNNFVIAGESYGGAYIPVFSRHIWDRNEELRTLQVQERQDVIEIPLESIMIGNGLTDVVKQAKGSYIYGCESPYAMLNKTQCDLMAKYVPICEQLLKICQDEPSNRTCEAVSPVCDLSDVPWMELHINPYDIRKTCDMNKGIEDCAQGLHSVNAFLNKPGTKKELGVPDHVTFTSCNLEVGMTFAAHFDVVADHSKFLIKMLAEGLRVLLYIGEEDLVCNYEGNFLWAKDLESIFKKEFNNAPVKDFVPALVGKKQGTVRTVGPGAGNFTFLTIEDAGHMVPGDNPVAALDMLRRWLKNQPLY
ncbi:peptidase S10 serine carboxypeptidase [Atractiella rhizophila]|nr:peptidase S10 serine carboxypeptidase [Atractiella rhizophila]